MDFDFDDLDGDDKSKVRDFNVKFIMALNSDLAKAELAKLRDSCASASEFARERTTALGPLLDPLFEEDHVTLEWIENQNWVLKEEDEEIAEQFALITELFSFGVLGPLELEKGEAVQAIGLEGGVNVALNLRIGVVLSFMQDSGLYVVQFYPQSVLGLPAANLRKLDKYERLLHMQSQLIERLSAPDAKAELNGLRASCGSREEFNEVRWARIGPLLDEICKHHGVELSWILDNVETLSATSAQVAEKQKLTEALMSYALGPLQLEKGDCVEVSDLESEEQRHLNGKKGLVLGWFDEHWCYEVRVVGDQPTWLKPGCLRRISEIEKAQAVQKQIMDVLATPGAQGALDMLRAKCANMVQYLKKLPETMRQVSGPAFEAFGVDDQWYAMMLDSHPKDRELRSVSKRIETLTSFGKTGPWGLEKGAFYEAYGIADRENKDMNGVAVLILDWDDSSGCYIVSPVGKPFENRYLPAENLKQISDQRFTSKEAALAFENELRSVYDSPAAQETLAALTASRPDVREYLAALRPTLLTLQRPLLKQYGFREDLVGQNHMQRAIALHEVDPEVARLSAELDHFGLRELRYDGRVAIVTGGGRGLGRAYAMLLAARGAMVVVNNRTQSKADEVVGEITAKGGTAIAEYSDLSNSPDDVVPFCLKAFGKIDILVCNAGQLDDHRFEIMKSEYFTTLLATHVLGHYKILKAAWPYLVNQQYGRIVLISSESGLHGNWGQSNYGACKMAMASMGQTLAMEGFAHGILCNCVCPVGLTRMTNDLRPVHFRAPEWELQAVSQPSDKAVAYLCHESCRTTAAIFRAEGGKIQALRLQSDDAFVAFDVGSATALEAVGAQWPVWGKWEHCSYLGDELHRSYLHGLKAPMETGFAGPKGDKGKGLDKLQYDERVAIVTHGGRGLGRSVCLLLASRGARIVVNDPDMAKADAVVAEIKKQGGEAVAEYSDVAEAGEAIVEECMRIYDQVDIVVAHATRRHDADFASSTFEQFAGNLNTDLIGHVKVLQAAWPQMFMGRFGRIVLITSDSGMYGGERQISYGAAKGSHIAVSQTLAMEGYKYNILINSIGTTDDRFSDAELERKGCSAAVPVAYLCHESCKATAGIFRVNGGKVSSLRWQSDDAFVDFDPEMGDAALEPVASQWSDTAKFTKVSYPGQNVHFSYR